MFGFEFFSWHGIQEVSFAIDKPLEEQKSPHSRSGEEEFVLISVLDLYKALISIPTFRKEEKAQIKERTSFLYIRVY